MPCYLNEYPWPSLATPPYRPWPPEGPPGYIPYRHKAAVCRFGLVILPLLVKGVHRCTSLMSSSLLLQQYPTCLVRQTLIDFVMGGRWPLSKPYNVEEIVCFRTRSHCSENVIIIIVTSSRFFTPALANGLLFELKWQVSKGLQDASFYSGWS